jgi:hypothetical protein
MPETNKKALGLTALLAGTIAVLAFWRRKEEGGSASVSIRIYDKNGNPVPHSSPYNLVEGEYYTIELTVTNQSKLGGNPCEAQLTIDLEGNLSWGGAPVDLFIPWGWIDIFQPSEARTYTHGFTCPVGPGISGSGSIVATVSDPDGNQLDSATEPVTTVTIQYGADLDLGVGGSDNFVIDTSVSPASAGAGVSINLNPFKQLYSLGDIVTYTINSGTWWLVEIQIYHHANGITEHIPFSGLPQYYQDTLYVDGDLDFTVFVGAA